MCFYLHWYRLEFNSLTTVEQRTIIGSHYIHHIYNDEDDNDDVIFLYPDIA